MVEYDKNGKLVAEYDGQERLFDDIPFTVKRKTKGGPGSGRHPGPGHEETPTITLTPNFRDAGQAARWSQQNLNAKWTNYVTTGIQMNQRGNTGFDMQQVQETLNTIKELEDRGYKVPDFAIDNDACKNIGAVAFYDPANDRTTYSLHMGTTFQPGLEGARDVIGKFIGEGRVEKGSLHMGGTELSPRGTVYHELSHAQNARDRSYYYDPRGGPHDRLIDSLSKEDNRKISLISDYSKAAVGRTTFGTAGTVPRLEESYAESVGAIADKNPVAQYVPDSVKESIYTEFPHLRIKHRETRTALKYSNIYHLQTYR
jgi:hypothetical protein